jgi:hypothetical protein
MGVPPRSKVAFVTGANGISGFNIIEHLVRQPKEEWYEHPICAPIHTIKTPTTKKSIQQEQDHYYIQTTSPQRLDRSPSEICGSGFS